MSQPSSQGPFLQFLRNAFIRGNDETMQIPIKMERPLLSNYREWQPYWTAQGQPWRTEPEIDAKRQAYLAQRRAIVPDVRQNVYPFKNIALSRADVEWLLATHENGRGPVDWSDERQRERKGLDLRGARLYRINLSGLPLACIQGGLSVTDIFSQKEIDKTLPADNQFDEAGVCLELARLSHAHLEGANLRNAQMIGAILEKANMEQAILELAHLEDADLREVNLRGGRIKDGHLERTILDGAHMEGAFLAMAHLENARMPGSFLEDARLIQAHMEGVDLRNAHLERSDLTEAHLEQAVLRNAHLKQAFLQAAHLEGADLTNTNLGSTNLSKAHLEYANLSASQMQNASFHEAFLEAAFLNGIHAEEADFYQAHLEGVSIQSAHLERCNLSQVCLAGANLMGTHLEGADLRNAHLEGKTISDDDLQRICAWNRQGVLAWTFQEHQEPADLRRVFFDTYTQLDDCVFGTSTGTTLIGNTTWGDVNLTVVHWNSVRELGDERVARHMLQYWKQNKRAGNLKREDFPLYEYQVYAQLVDAVRANRQMAIALQSQGMNEEGARFSYRAQVLQRRVLLWQVAGRQMELPQNNIHRGSSFWQRVHAFLSYLFSRFLDIIAGYGYQPWKSFLAYLVIIFGFMGLYLLNAHFVTPHLRWDEALVLSVSSFHGRGFFPQNISLGDTYARLAATEAVIGLLIEICRVDTRRGALLPLSECPPPNPACKFLCTGLSSIIGVAPSENVIPLV